MFKITSNLKEGNSIRVIEGAREKEALKEIEKLEAEIIKVVTNGNFSDNIQF
jgi:hypothetical protein